MGVIAQGLGGVALVTQGYVVAALPGRVAVRATVIGGAVITTADVIEPGG